MIQLRRKSMKKVLMSVVMMGLTGGAYAADFSDLAVKAADLKGLGSSGRYYRSGYF